MPLPSSSISVCFSGCATLLHPLCVCSTTSWPHAPAVRAILVNIMGPQDLHLRCPSPPTGASSHVPGDRILTLGSINSLLTMWLGLIISTGVQVHAVCQSRRHCKPSQKGAVNSMASYECKRPVRQCLPFT